MKEIQKQQENTDNSLKTLQKQFEGMKSVPGQANRQTGVRVLRWPYSIAENGDYWVAEVKTVLQAIITIEGVNASSLLSLPTGKTEFSWGETSMFIETANSLDRRCLAIGLITFEGSANYDKLPINMR